MICIVRARNSRNNIGSRPHPGLSPTPNRNEPAFAPPKAGRERTEILLSRTNRRRERRRRKEGRQDEKSGRPSLARAARFGIGAEERRKRPGGSERRTAATVVLVVVVVVRWKDCPCYF